MYLWFAVQEHICGWNTCSSKDENASPRGNSPTVRGWSRVTVFLRFSQSLASLQPFNLDLTLHLPELRIAGHQFRISNFCERRGECIGVRESPSALVYGGLANKIQIFFVHTHDLKLGRAHV